MKVSGCPQRTMQRITVKTTINGKDYSFEVEPRLLLVDLIRDKAGLTGTHAGCDTGNCGACTVLMNGLTVKSCQVLAPRARGAEIRTVEGLARNGALHPVQEAFWVENPHPSDEDIRRAYSGNLCRCTGYLNIIKAVKRAAETMES